MTTIAYKNGIMAADTMMTRGDEPTFGISKVFRVQNLLVGVSGSYSNMAPFRDFMEAHVVHTHFNPVDLYRHWDDVPDFNGGFCALIVDHNGTIYSSVDAPPVELPHASFDAIGSGGKFAMGAMAAGADAYEAVKIASSLDVCTGGLIQRWPIDNVEKLHG